MATITLHQPVTITFHQDDDSCYNRNHNKRDPYTITREVEKGTSTVNPDGWHENWIDIDVRQAYEDIFGEPVKEYNEKQKRKDRKIDSYYQEIKKDKVKSTVYECIVGVYGVNNSNLSHDILKRFVDDFQADNPHIKVIGAYYHADEEGKEPHVHLDWIPIADGYTKGLKVQTSLTKALMQEGYTKMDKDNNGTTAQFWNRERQRIIDICAEYDIEAIIKKDEKRKHLNTKEYKQTKRIEALNEKVEKLDAEIASITAERDILEADNKTLSQIQNKLKIENAQLTRANEEAKRREEALRMQIENMQRDMDELREMLRKENEAYKTNKATYQSEIEELENYYNEIYPKVKDVQNTVAYVMWQKAQNADKQRDKDIPTL